MRGWYSKIPTDSLGRLDQRQYALQVVESRTKRKRDDPSLAFREVRNNGCV